MKLSIVMPVYNEKDTLYEIVGKVLKVNTGMDKELIVVDDASTDGTNELVRGLPSTFPDADIKTFFHKKNMGKGAGIQTAFREVTGDVVIIQDADLEYDPNEYANVLGPIIEGKADVVFGSRFLGGPHRVHLFLHYLGNRFLTFLANCFYNINLTDMETCYKAFKSDVAKKLNLKSKRFGIEPEITAKVSKMRCVIYEVPISYYGRSYEEGKKITWKDGISALWNIIKYRFVD